MKQAPFESKKYRPAFKGICRDAEILGCNRMHLRMVLNGTRQSMSLTRRYNELKGITTSFQNEQ
jgi:hypothetical protein